MIILLSTLDYRLGVPLIAWFFAYSGLLYYFLPRLSKVATRQADARLEMTGRIVDSYSNIATVKLLSHSRREANYAREGLSHSLDRVYPLMRLATLLLSGGWAHIRMFIFN